MTAGLRAGVRRSVPVLYAGGFLGPFAASLSSAILPELGATFARTPDQATAAVTAYLVPFASIMLISGALGRRWGLTRTTTVAYVLLVLSSIGSALAPTWGVFLVCQALSGGLNAFTTPLLIAVLGQVTAPERLGRALGLFASLQSLGLLCGPLLSGLAALSSWRFAYLTVAALAAAMVLAGPPRVPRSEAPWRVLFDYLTTPWTYLLAVTVLLVGACVNGLVPVTVLHALDRWELGPVARGLLVMSGGVAAMLVSTPVGRLLDRFGPYRVAGVSIVVAVVALPPAAAMTGLWGFAASWFVASGATQATIVALMTALMRTPGGPSAISVFQGARFGGVALAPILFVPLYQRSIEVVLAASAVGLVAALALLPLVASRDRTAQ